jgi:hypothetical protein
MAHGVKVDQRLDPLPLGAFRSRWSCRHRQNHDGPSDRCGGIATHVYSYRLADQCGTCVQLLCREHALRLQERLGIEWPSDQGLVAGNSWVGLELGRNWGNIFYARAGEKWVDGESEPKNGLVLTVGDETPVRFPSGTAIVVHLDSEVRKVVESDMGHEYRAELVFFGFWLDVDGLRLWVPLESVQIPPRRFLTQIEARVRQCQAGATGSQP